MLSSLKRAAYIFISFFVFAFSCLALDEGDSCSKSKKLPKEYSCIDRTVVNCGGHIGWLACTGAKNTSLQNQINGIYKRAQFDLQSKKPTGTNKKYDEARQALIESQIAWLNFYKKDCDTNYSLFGSGNAASQDYIQCEQRHFIARLKQLKEIQSRIEP